MAQDLFRFQPAAVSAFSGPNSTIETPGIVADSSVAPQPINQKIAGLIATAQPILDFISRRDQIELEEKRLEKGGAVDEPGMKEVKITSNVGLNPDAVQVPKVGILIGVGLIAAGGLALLLRGGR